MSDEQGGSASPGGGDTPDENPIDLDWSLDPPDESETVIEAVYEGEIVIGPVSNRGLVEQLPEWARHSRVGCFLVLLVLAFFAFVGFLLFALGDKGKSSSTDATASAEPVDGAAGDEGDSGSDAFVPRSGDYVVVNGAGSIVCAGVEQPLLPAAPETATLMVLDSGRSIVATGMGDGVGEVVFERVETSQSYRGLVTRLETSGAFEFEFTMDFDREDHFDGLMEGVVRAGGVSCEARRSAEGSRVGEPSDDNDEGDNSSGGPSDPDDDIVTGVRVVPAEGFASCEVGERTDIVEPIVREEPREALRAYLDEGSGTRPPVPPPYVELRRNDGAVFYGWEESGRLAGVIEIGPMGDGVAAVALVTADCPEDL